MSLPNENTKISYTGNGSTTVFAYNFKVFNKAHLRVLIDSTEKTLDVDYTVTGVGEAAGGSVIFTTAPVNEISVVIMRDMDAIQETEYTTSGSFPATAHEAALDRLTMMVQQVQEQVDRMPLLPVHTYEGEGLDPLELPLEAGYAIGWNAAGNALTLMYDLGTVGDTLAGFGVSPTGFAGGTNIILDSLNKAISINSATWQDKGIQLQYNSGTPRAYIGDGADKYFQFDEDGMRIAGTITVTGGSGIANFTDAVSLVKDNPYVVRHSWLFRKSDDGFTVIGATKTNQSNSILVESTGGTPQFIRYSLSVDGEKEYLIRVRIKRVAGSGWRGTVFYKTGGHNYSASYEKTISQPSTWGSDYHILEWDMSDLTAGGTDWLDNTITDIRFDLGNTASDDFEIDWIAIGNPGAAEAGIYPILPSDENLTGYWSMDDGAGCMVTDNSGNGYDGVIANGEGDEWAPGIAGMAFAPDANDEEINCGNTNDITTQDFSISARVKMTASGTNDYIVSKLSTTGFLFYKNDSDNFVCALNDGGGMHYLGGSTDISDGNQYHLVATFDRNGYCLMYVNGELTDTIDITADAGSITNAGDFIIGGGTTPSGTYISKVRFYKGQVLTTKEVKALYLYPSGNQYQTISGAQTPWSHASDVTKIDGGKVYIGSNLLVGGASQGGSISVVDATFGNAGIQLLRVDDDGWKTKAYFGDGANEFLKYVTGSGVSISTAQANAFTIKGGGSMTLEVGGDINFGLSDANPSLLKWGVIHNMGASSTGSRGLCTWPTTGDSGYWRLGFDSIANTVKRYSLISLDAWNSISITVENPGASTFGFLSLTGAYSMLSHQTAGGSSSLYCEGPLAKVTGTAFHPATDSVTTNGTASLCWSNIYGDAGVTSCSDPKLKVSVKESPFGLNLIEKLDIVQWEWDRTAGKTLERKWHGILAPDVLGVLEELGYSHDDFGGINLEDVLDDDGNKTGETWGFRYEQLIGPLCKAVQELSTEINHLKTLH